MSLDGPRAAPEGPPQRSEVTELGHDQHSPDKPGNRMDREVADLGGEDRQVAALTRIAEALERLADDVESNHRGGRGVFDAGNRP